MAAGVVTKKLHQEAAQAWGRSVRMGMAYRDIAQNELAKRMGYKSPQAVSYWCHGKRVPTFPLMIATAQALNIPLAQLVDLGAVDYDAGEFAPGSDPKRRF